MWKKFISIFNSHRNIFNCMEYTNKLLELVSLARWHDRRSIYKNQSHFYIPAINNQKLKFKKIIYNSIKKILGDVSDKGCVRLAHSKPQKLC